MRKLVLTSLILVLAFGCENPFSVRMTADYFPLKKGNKWIYEVKKDNNYQIEMDVINDEDSLVKVNVGGDTQYFERKIGIVNRVRDLTTTYEGEKVTFGRIYEPYLFLPPIEGENWHKEFTLSSVYKGDMVSKYFSVNVDSVISTSIVLNSKSYENVYRLRRIVVEDEDSLVQYEWFAPDIGLLKKLTLPDSVTWELTSFTINEQ
jgi:hypothetical protein